MSIERYIRLATAGMPRKERLERGAELRSNLLAHVKHLQDEGYSRHEAEALAVEELGPPAMTNRMYWLGKLNTLGWILLMPLLLGSVAFAGWWFIPRPVGIALFQPDDRSFDQGYRLTLPRDTEFVHVAAIVFDGSTRLSIYPVSFESRDKTRPTFRDQLAISGGVQKVDDSSKCYLMFELRIEIGSDKRDTSCLEFAHRVADGAWFEPIPGTRTLESDRWVPLGAFLAYRFEPDVPVRERAVGDVYDRIAFDRVGVMVYLGAEDPPAPPTWAELHSVFPGLPDLTLVSDQP